MEGATAWPPNPLLSAEAQRPVGGRCAAAAPRGGERPLLSACAVPRGAPSPPPRFAPPVLRLLSLSCPAALPRGAPERRLPVARSAAPPRSHGTIPAPYRIPALNNLGWEQRTSRRNSCSPVIFGAPGKRHVSFSRGVCRARGLFMFMFTCLLVVFSFWDEPAGYYVMAN